MKALIKMEWKCQMGFGKLKWFVFNLWNGSTKYQANEGLFSKLLFKITQNTIIFYGILSSEEQQSSKASVTLKET